MEEQDRDEDVAYGEPSEPGNQVEPGRDVEDQCRADEVQRQYPVEQGVHRFALGRGRALTHGSHSASPGDSPVPRWRVGCLSIRPAPVRRDREREGEGGRSMEFMLLFMVQSGAPDPEPAAFAEMKAFAGALADRGRLRRGAPLVADSAGARIR